MYLNTEKMYFSPFLSRLIVDIACLHEKIHYFFIGDYWLRTICTDKVLATNIRLGG